MHSPIPAMFDALRQSQLQPRAVQEKHQRVLLERLLRHARENVPFYRDTGRLDPVFRGDGSIDWDRWGEIPLLTRHEVQQNFEALRAEALGPEHGRTWTLTTSGSTSEPVKVAVSLLAGRTVWAAQLLRDLERHRIDPRRRLAFLSPHTKAAERPPTTPSAQFWYPPFADLALHGERYSLNDTRPATQLIEWLEAIRPTYLRVQPLVLQLIVANDRAGRLKDLGIEVAMTVGDQFPFDAKRDVSLHLGCRIMDHYASQECGRVATTCPICTRFHVDADVNAVEVLNDDGEPVKPGEAGWMFVTPLYNYAMPLIRYDHADRAVVGEPDQCPITFPALDAIIGKEREPFSFPDGSTIRPSISTPKVIELTGAQRYQIAQTAPDRCEMRIVPGSLRREEMRLDEMTKCLKAALWSGLTIDYKILDEIPRRSMRAKLPLFVREIATSEAAV